MKRKYFSRGFSNAKKCVYKGIKFDSQLERDKYIHLLKLQSEGKIEGLKIQVPFSLIPKIDLSNHIVYSLGKSKKTREAFYVCDFFYKRVIDNQYVIMDTKGRTVPIYRLKLKIILWLYGKRNQFIEVYRDNKIDNFLVY